MTLQTQTIPLFQAPKPPNIFSLDLPGSAKDIAFITSLLLVLCWSFLRPCGPLSVSDPRKPGAFERGRGLATGENGATGGEFGAGIAPLLSFFAL